MALVGTDVAARGVHIDGISLVVHVDVPQDHKDYLGRSSRTARAGESGAVVTLTTSEQQKSVSGLTSRARVTPKAVSVTSQSAELMRVTEPKSLQVFLMLHRLLRTRVLTVEPVRLVRIRQRDAVDQDECQST